MDPKSAVRSEINVSVHARRKCRNYRTEPRARASNPGRCAQAAVSVETITAARNVTTTEFCNPTGRPPSTANRALSHGDNARSRVTNARRNPRRRVACDGSAGGSAAGVPMEHYGGARRNPSSLAEECWALCHGKTHSGRSLRSRPSSCSRRSLRSARSTPKQGEAVRRESRRQFNAALSVVVSTVMMMAYKEFPIEQEQKEWTRDFLSLIRDGDGKTPPNITGILWEIEQDGSSDEPGKEEDVKAEQPEEQPEEQPKEQPEKQPEEKQEEQPEKQSQHSEQPDKQSQQSEQPEKQSQQSEQPEKQSQQSEQPEEQPQQSKQPDKKENKTKKKG